MLPAGTFLFGTRSTVNFTVELSEVLSVVLVLVFNYEYFNLHILGILASLLLAGKPHRLFFHFTLLSVGKIFIHEYSDIICNLEKDTPSSG